MYDFTKNEWDSKKHLNIIITNLKRLKHLNRGHLFGVQWGDKDSVRDAISVG